jgi:hypothetical protein
MNLLTWLTGSFAAAALLGWKAEWSNLVAYTYGQTVRHIDAVYVAVVDNTNSAPTRVGTAPTNPNWDIITIDGNPGASGDIVWKGIWNSGTTYAVKEAATNNGSSYVCKVSHTNQARLTRRIGMS